MPKNFPSAVFLEEAQVFLLSFFFTEWRMGVSVSPNIEQLNKEADVFTIL